MRFTPVLAAVLVLLWLVLNDTLAPAQLVLGIIIASVLSGWTARMRPLWPRLHRPLLALGLLWTALLDIVRSNIAVGRIILGGARRRSIHSGLLEVPLELRDPHGLAALATIITSTPGTVWVGHDPQRNVVTLHILDLKDEASWIRLIKDRYERPLIGIFQS